MRGVGAPASGQLSARWEVRLLWQNPESGAGPIRNRDLVSSSAQTKALFRLHDWLAETGNIELFSRPYRGMPTPHVEVA